MEGFLASVVVLAAVVISLQATVATPATGGGIDETSASQLRGEATDLLVSLGEDGQLVAAVQYWSSTEQRFHDSRDEATGYGADGPPAAVFDDAFDDAFGQRGYSYNVVFRYRGGDPSNVTSGSTDLAFVWQGRPTDDAVSTSYTVTLYDNMTLNQNVNDDGRELWEYDQDAGDGDDGYFPIPDAAPDSALYNVVEIRVTVW
jgi:FlaG/FlaF family flagellin (archaellin)